MKTKVVVLGAGVGGLAAGYFLTRTGKYDVTVLEKAPFIGGLCASFEYEGFTLDQGAHKIYSVIPGILDEIQRLMGPRLMRLPKKHRLFLRGRLVDYPLSLGNIATALGPATLLAQGLGFAGALAGGLLDRRQPRSYEEYMLRQFGRPAYELVFKPLAEKVWGVPHELHPEMARTRIPTAGGLDVILKLLGLKKETEDTNAEFFFYPKKGFGDWPQALREQIEAAGGRVVVDADVRGLDRRHSEVTAVRVVVRDRPAEFPCDFLVSSIPLHALGQLVFTGAEAGFNRLVEDLQFRHLMLVYVFVNRPRVLQDQWIFFPEREYIFSRIFEQKQMNPALGPEDRTAICCDFTCSEGSWEWKASDEVIADKVIDGLVRAGFIGRQEVGETLVKRVRNFYPRYDLAYVEKLQKLNLELQGVSNLMLTGRVGMYNYNNSDHCADMGRFIADRLVQGWSPIDIWKALEARVATYRIVD